MSPLDLPFFLLRDGHLGDVWGLRTVTSFTRTTVFTIVILLIFTIIISASLIVIPAFIFIRFPTSIMVAPVSTNIVILTTFVFSGIETFSSVQIIGTFTVIVSLTAIARIAGTAMGVISNSVIISFVQYIVFADTVTRVYVVIFNIIGILSVAI